MSQRGRAGIAALAPWPAARVLYAPRAPAVDTGGLPVDKLVHVLVFALPTAALIVAGVPRGWVIGLMAVHAPLSEVLQHRLLAERSGEPRDVVADLVGVALGALVAWRWDPDSRAVVDPVGESPEPTTTRVGDAAAALNPRRAPAVPSGDTIPDGRGADGP